MVFLDTGYHFVETIGTRDAVEATLPVNLHHRSRRCRPSPSRTRRTARTSTSTDPDLCCALRKVAAADRARSQEYDAWATGLRRAETHNRVIAPVVGWDAARAKVKVSPLARWSDDDVERYIASNGVLVNPLRLRRLPVDRLRAVHPPRRPRRRPAQRPLGRHHQDRVRDPPMTRHSQPTDTRRSVVDCPTRMHREEAVADGRSCPGGPGPRKP